MKKRLVKIIHEFVSENYKTEGLSIIIHCKKSEMSGLAYDLRCILYDAVDVHDQFMDVEIMEP